MLALLVTASLLAAEPPIVWDSATLRLVAPDGAYGRMRRLSDGAILLCYERAGRSYTQRSTAGGSVWSEPVVAATSAVGAAANPELLPLADGRVLLLYNERPRDGRTPFSIRTAFSGDLGRSWSAGGLLFAGGAQRGEGVWEPAGVQEADGTIRVWFANGAPYGNTGEQEISTCLSHDGGASWTAPIQASFRPHHRDGMPVPVRLLTGELLLAIEDDGLNGAFKPALVRADKPAERWAVAPELAPASYAGAPYGVAMPDGRVVVSCQNGDRLEQARMAVWLGDASGHGFVPAGTPFGAVTSARGLWNSLFVKSPDTLVAVSGTRIDGRGGIWTIEGRVR